MREEDEKKRFLGRTLFFYMGLVVVLCVSACIAHFVQSPYSGVCRVYHVDVTLETQNEARLDLYYDIGRDYNEVDHQTRKLVRTGEKQEVHFTVPVWKELKKIRIDPGQGYVNMSIYSIIVSSANGDFSYSVPLKNVRPGQQIINPHWSGDRYSFETPPDAEDPILLDAAINDPHVQRQQKSLATYLIWVLGGLVVTVFGNIAFRFFILGL